MPSGTTVPILTAFLAGLLSFLSPCVLPLVPVYLSYISGVSVEDLTSASGSAALRRTGLKSALFVLGFSTVFIALGASAAPIGDYLNRHALVLMRVAGVIIIIFGLHMIGVFRIRALYGERRFHSRLTSVSYAGAFLIGITFAFGWTPCVGPILATILVIAADSKTVLRGVALLAVYSLGLGVPFLIVGFSAGAALKALGRVKRHFRKVEIAGGMLMIVVGLFMFKVWSLIVGTGWTIYSHIHAW